MVSPPEFHYREETLTMPLVTVTGSGTISDSATITRTSTQQYFPNTDLDPDYENPLEAKNLVVTVQSEHYEAWGTYFEERTEGTVSYDHPNEEVTIELVPPFDEAFENVLATTSPGGITVNGADPPPSPNEEGVNYPSPDPRIEDAIADCPSATCTSGVPGTITSAGTYYHGSGSDYTGTLIVDDPDGDVLVVVDGDFEPSDVVIEDVDPGNSVTVYTREDFTINTAGKDRLNSDFDADATEFRVFVHSDGEVDSNGNSGMFGVVLAPGSTCDLNGGGSLTPNIEGSIVCDTVDINGNPNDFQYDPAVQGMDLGISNPQTVRLQYLHVSTTEVKIEGN
jgi:hypothetical protein